MNTPPLNIALTGITGFAACYLKTFSRNPEAPARLKAVTAINRDDQEARCRELEAEGTEIFTDFEAMLDAWRDRIDLSILPVPIHLHLPMTLASLHAGMNVLLEKPMAGSVEEGRKICAAATRGRRVAIGFQDLYRPSTHRISRQLREGKIGDLTRITVCVLWPRQRSYYQRNNWAGALEVDGHVVRDSPLNNATAHYTNLALFFAGPGGHQTARAAKVEAELFRARDIPSFDTAVVRLTTDTGVPLQIAVTHSCQQVENATIRIEGSKGSMHWATEEQVRWETPAGTEREALEDFDENRTGMWYSILNALQTGEEFCCTPEMAMAHVELVEKLHLEYTIRNFPKDRLALERKNGDLLTYLPGLDQDLKRCLAENALPSELGISWAN